MFLTPQDRSTSFSESPCHSVSSTNASHRRRDSRAFPTAQLALLALVRLAEPIALTSIQPYAWKLVLNFNVGEKNDASFYAGLLVAAFALAESLTGMFWGGLSDRIGRKPVLLSGCVGTILSLLIVGFSSSFAMAVVGRALGGFLNGNIGVLQTMVGELVARPEHEPRAYAVMPFVWSVGTIIGPAIGGYFSEPCKNFPSVFPKHGLFDRYPFLLPNLICAALLLVGILTGLFLIEETHPAMQPWSSLEDVHSSEAETPMLATAGANSDAPVDLRNPSYGTFNSVSVETDGEMFPIQNQSRPSSISSSDSYTKAFTRPVIMLVISLGIFTYHCMTYDNLLPIFFQDVRPGAHSESESSSPFSGGLGLSLQDVGIILSFNGIIALFVQGVIFPIMASWLGVWKLFVLVMVGHPLVYIIVPFLPLVPENTSWLYAAIYGCLTVRNFFSILAYPVLLILIKEAAPGPSSLGKINGLAASTGAACRTIASPVAGYLYTAGANMEFTPLAWWSSAFVALIGAIQALTLRRSRHQTPVAIQNPTYFEEVETKIAYQDEEVARIIVEELI